MFQVLAIVAIIIVGGIAAFAATRPNSFRIQRSARIKAPPETIFPLIEDFHRWEAWSPWEKLDPALKRLYSGAEKGPGAVYQWEGNKNVGYGRMEISESAPPSKLVIKLDFIKPFEAHNTVEFTLVPENGGTQVTQAMYGPSPFMSKLMGLFMNMDKMVGGKYEEGLANLAAIAEHQG
jgi:uncharacterized protein YndB with AHSA1/START domain